MATGDAISVTMITTAAAAGYAATVNIDGGAVALKTGLVVVLLLTVDRVVLTSMHIQLLKLLMRLSL